MANIGNLKKLSITEIKKLWPHEEKDLSPWIVENIDSLNEVLKLQIEIESSEEYIFNFRLDLAGTENYSQMPVIIENQFGISNHDHLGKLLTYSANKEAGIIIWIANEIQTAHRNTIEWLNKISPEEMTFYCVELEVFQIDESLPAPNYRIVAGPPPSNRRGLPPGEISARYKKYLEFFEKLKAKVFEKDTSFTRKVMPWSYWSLGIGRSGFSLANAFTIESTFRIEIYIDTGNKENNEEAFTKLKENKESIEEKIGIELTWDLLPDKRANRIYIAIDGSIDDSEEKLNNIIEWAVPYLIKFKEVFSPIVRNI